MSTVLKLVLARWLAARTFGGVLSFFALLALPLAGILKLIGLPLLVILALVGVPIALVLAIVGLPLLIVAGTVMAIVSLVGVVLAVAFALLKPLIPLILAFLVIRALWRWSRRPSAPHVYDGPPPAAATVGADI